LVNRERGEFELLGLDGSLSLSGERQLKHQKKTGLTVGMEAAKPTLAYIREQFWDVWGILLDTVTRLTSAIAHTKVGATLHEISSSSIAIESIMMIAAAALILQESRN
jgi:hypothetical protein